MKQQPKIEMEKLAFLVGKWHTQGTVCATTTTPEITISGIDTYEYVSNGLFILHTISVMMGEEIVEGIEVIGFDEKLQKYVLQSFDGIGAITFMYGHLNNNAFVIIGNGQRATLTVNTALPEMKALWEQSEDGKVWMHWMDLTFGQ